MVIVTDKKKCYHLAEEYFSTRKDCRILSGWKVKKTLNDFFEPDSYLFFKSDNSILPLVVKKNVCYFFGGDLPFNEGNKAESALVSKAIQFLNENDFHFKLTSINSDPISYLKKEQKRFDVPFNQWWAYKNINSFDESEFIKSQKKKKRDKLKRAQRLVKDIQPITATGPEYRSLYLKEAMLKTSNVFSQRGLANCWKDKKLLLNSLFDGFVSEFPSFNRVFIDRQSRQMIASYNMFLNEEEIFLAFSNCFDFSRQNIQFMVYLDILRNASLLATSSNSYVNAGRGSFGYKKRMGFEAIPVYALVNHPEWKTQKDKDLTAEETLTLYKREFGCFS